MINRTEKDIMSKWEQLSPPLVSILCITYNHEEYIAEALDSFLMQRTTFPFEIIIGEDSSVDGTMSIIKEYEKKYPHLIKIISSDTNVGMQKNFIRTFNAAKSDYIALCEGDDYWIDTHKLQKQITYLENNPQCAICCHKSENYNQENKTIINHYPKIDYEKEFSLYDLFHTNIANTCTFVYRNQYIQLPSFFENLYVGDWPLHMIHAQYGKIKYLPENMARYRIHSQGVWSGDSLFKKLEHINNMLSNMDHYFKLKYHIYIYKTIGRNLFDQSLHFIDIDERHEFCKKLINVLDPSTLCFIKIKYKEKIRKNFPELFNTIKNIIQKIHILQKKIL